MKKVILSILLMGFGQFTQAQIDLSKMSSSNTWIKLGINMAVPFAELGKDHTVGLGLDLGIQFLETKASGIGLKVGYLNYLGKTGKDDATVIPLAIMFRHYPESVGIFLGLEVGYAFVSGIDQTDGGGYTRPQLGLHYYDWNFFGYYDHILIEENIGDLQAIGLGITYNIRFNKK